MGVGCVVPACMHVETAYSYTRYIQVYTVGVATVMHYSHAPFVPPAHSAIRTFPAFSILLVPSVYELWFKQILVELESVIAIMGAHTVAHKDLLTVVSRLNRVIQILKVHFDLCK